MADVKVSALTALTGADLANGDQFLVTDVGSPNVSKSITADELAQGSQFSGRYVAKADDDKVFVPVGAMEVIQGSPAVGLISGRWAGRLFDDASSEDMGTSFVVPAHWATMNIVLYWSHNVVAGTGDVVLYRAYERATGIGYALTTAGVAGTITAVAAPSYRELAATTLQSNISCADATNSLLMIRIGRAGADAADTFAGDVLFFGVMFEKAS